MEKKESLSGLKKFLATKTGMVVAFVTAVYLLTFCVYYFYSPGPEERNPAKNEPPATGQVLPMEAQQNSTIAITNGIVTQAASASTQPGYSSGQ